MKGVWELDGVEGNYKASYAVERTSAVHMLSVDDYADSVDSQPEHAWVLLGARPPAAKGAAQQPAARAPTAAPAPTPAALGKRKAPTSAAGSSSAATGAAGSLTHTAATQAAPVAPTPTPRALGKRKAAIDPTPAAGSSSAAGSAAGSSTVPTRQAPRRQQNPSPAPPDISKLSAKQLAELQVAIAHRMQQQ